MRFIARMTIRSHIQQMPTTPYRERTDLEKIVSQWRKLSGLQTRGEWSALVVRAATAAEISLNLAIRREFAAKSTFDNDFVDSMLRWANGIGGKVQRLLIPLVASQPGRLKRAKALEKVALRINAIRNAVVHQGEFCNEGEAIRAIADAQTLISEVVRWYEPQFALDLRQSKKARS